MDIFDNAKVIKGKYVRDEAKVKAYLEGIKRLEDILQQGQIPLAYRADNVDEALYIHVVEIKWLTDEVDISASEMGKVFTCFDSLYFSFERVFQNTWRLSSEIYREM